MKGSVDFNFIFVELSLAIQSSLDSSSVDKLYLHTAEKEHASYARVSRNLHQQKKLDGLGNYSIIKLFWKQRIVILNLIYDDSHGHSREVEKYSTS